MDNNELDKLKTVLYGGHSDIRQQAKKLILDLGLRRVDGVSYQRHRKIVMKQLKQLSSSPLTKVGFPKSLGGEANPVGGVALFEELVLVDPSLQIKYGVHYGLFSSAILNLGTPEQHLSFLPSALSLQTPGVFAMTETGHGSDVSNIRTTATYDKDSDTFILHTPDRSAWKDYLGNAAKYGRAAVVFAQLIVDGENHGVHAFYVPLRNRLGLFRKGITGQDDGAKGGLNGVDNGRLAFHNVLVPRDNLLSRFGTVNEDGRYFSPIDSRGKRFFTMLSTLVQGRVSLVGAVVNAQKLAITIATKYAHLRTQFPDSDGKETLLIDYSLHQRRLFPVMASVYAQTFVHQDLLSLFQEVFSSESPDDETVNLLETKAAALKAYTTWSALANIQSSREACGGQGYLAENQLATLHSDLDVYATFEGDNNVLLQLVAKRLLNEYKEEWLNSTLTTKTSTVIKEAAAKAIAESPIFVSIAFAKKHFALNLGRTLNTQDLKLFGNLFKDRTRSLTIELANAIRQSASPVEGFMNNQKLATELALAYAEQLTWESFMVRATDTSLPSELREALESLLWCHTTALLEKHEAWLIRKGYATPKQLKSLLEQIVNEQYPLIKDASLNLVDGFDLNDFITAPIITKPV